MISNTKLINDKKHDILLTIAEYKAKQKHLEKELSETLGKKSSEKGSSLQNKKKFDVTSKEINNLQQKKLSLLNELKTLESNYCKLGINSFF